MKSKFMLIVLIFICFLFSFIVIFGNTYTKTDKIILIIAMIISFILTIFYLIKYIIEKKGGK